MQKDNLYSILKEPTVWALPVLFTLWAAFYLMVQTACQKEMTDSDTQAVGSVLALQQEDNNVTNAVAAILYREALKYRDSTTLVGTCPIISYPDSSMSINQLTINFGTHGCFNNAWDSNKLRQGTITAQWRGSFFIPGTVMYINTQGYTVNNIAFNINQTIVCLDTNLKHQLDYKIISKDTMLSLGKSTTYNSAMLRTWNNNNTYTPFDDTYLIRGNASGIDYTGSKYNYAVTDTLLLNEGCKLKKDVKGSATFASQGKPVRYINFGNSTCNATVQVTINNINYPVLLK